MLVEDPSRLENQWLRPDVIVVGAGTMGIVLALQLAEAGRRVTVIETGPTEPDPEYRMRNSGVVRGRPFRGLIEGRMKGFGGTTQLWGGQIAAFTPADFSPRPFVPDWPISYNDLVPYFAEVRRLLSLPEAADDLTKSWTKHLDLGDALAISSHGWLSNPHFASLFGPDIRSSEDIAVVTGLELTQIEFENTSVQSIHATVNRSAAQIQFASPIVVLACGTLENVRLLLRSQAIDPACPFRDNRHIGRHFIDHIHFIGGRLVGFDRSKLRSLFETRRFNSYKMSVKIRMSDRFANENQLANCAGSFISGTSIKQYLREFRDLCRRIVSGASGPGAILEVVKRTKLMAQITLPLAWGLLVDKKGYNLFGSDILVGVEVEQLPTVGSYLFLDPDAPPSEAGIGVNWELGERELQSARAFVHQLGVLCERNGLGQLEIDPRLEALDLGFWDSASDAYHHMGGARMARTADHGVVDANQKVFGTQNLYIAGAAVFPRGSYANPTLTALAQTLRLADFLCGQGQGHGALEAVT